MKAKYPSTSNYSQTQQNNRYLGLYIPKYTSKTLSDEVKKIKIGNRYHRRPDLLAHDLYGSSRYWWLFAHYNRDILKDPVNDFVSGTTIVIPTKQGTIGVN